MSRQLRGLRRPGVFGRSRETGLVRGPRARGDHGKTAALKFLRTALKRYGRPKTIVTDRFRSYRSAMMVIGNADAQACGRWLNSRAENAHQPFRRCERAMARFRVVKTLQKFASVHASLTNHFNQDRHLSRRATFKNNRCAALAEWRQLSAA